SVCIYLCMCTCAHLLFCVRVGITIRKHIGFERYISNCISSSPHLSPSLRLDGEVGGLFLQAPPCVGVGARLAGARDSGYDSLRRRMSVLDRLVQTHVVWLQLGLNHADSTSILEPQPTGTFLVRKSTTLQRKVISLRMHQDSETPVKDFPVKESQYTFSLEGSGLGFADLFRLVAFCCISR
ncbi:unnamed protein product, partial [Oncorhynchus mykiss]